MEHLHDRTDYEREVAVGEVTQDYSKLSDREIDALVAERVMGWTLSPDVDNWLRNHPTWRPSTDDNAVRLVRNRIAELGGEMQDHFCRALNKLLDTEVARKSGNHTYVSTWLLIHATPRQQCEAALRVLDGRRK